MAKDKWSYKDILANQDMSDHVGKRKIAKFFRIAIPIFVIEVVAIIVLVTYLLMLPKNYCKVSINMKDAVVYIDGKKSDEFRFNDPEKQAEHYLYKVDISVVLPGTDEYEVTFNVKCEKYLVHAATIANVKNGLYVMTVKGGEKTQLINAIAISSTEKIKNFEVNVVIDVVKI